MESLIQRSREIVEAGLVGKRNPVIMFSGGKDSVVMVHLLKFIFRKRFDVLFHREPWLTHKYTFAESVIRNWGLTIYDYPPCSVSMWEGKGILAFTNYYQIGPVRPNGEAPVLALPKNIVEPQPNRPYLCGLLDIIQRPTGTFRYPWDLAFIGHKSSDEDQIAGKVPLKFDTVDNEDGPRLAFPLRDWRDEDVWDYIEANGLPVQADRYNVQLRTELPDKTFNSDYFETCIRCIDRRHGSPEVVCPKLGNTLVKNRSDEVPYSDIRPSYIESP